MGHSGAYLDAEWLANKLLGRFFTEERPLCGDPELPNMEKKEESPLYVYGGIVVPNIEEKEIRPLYIEPELPNLNKTFEMSPNYPELLSDSPQSPETIGASKTLTIRFPQDEPEPLDPARPISPGERAKWHSLNDLYMIIHDWTAPRIPDVRTYRKDARKSLREGRSENQEDSERLPFFYRNWSLHISRKTTTLELTLQLALIFWRWGWSEPTTDDLASLRRFIKDFLRFPQEYASAIEEVPSYFFERWVLPEDPRSFRAYARRMVKACYAQTVGEIGHSFEKEEEFAANAKHYGKGRNQLNPDSDSVSVRQLASQAITHRRRIYEAIKDGRLQATKGRISTRIERESARQFTLNSEQQREIRRRRSQLENMGMSDDAIRKSIWRFLYAKQQPEIRQLRSQLEDLGMSRDAIRQRINRFRKDAYDGTAVLRHLQWLIEKKKGQKK